MQDKQALENWRGGECPAGFSYMQAMFAFFLDDCIWDDDAEVLGEKWGWDV